LIGQPGSGKIALLAELANQRDMKVMNVGATAGERLAAMLQRQRALQTNVILRELADEYANGDLLLLDNIELLFDQTLRLNPLDLLKRHAHSRRVVSVWPGELVDGRLTMHRWGIRNIRTTAWMAWSHLKLKKRVERKTHALRGYHTVRAD
jgi:hypothetical protein